MRATCTFPLLNPLARVRTIASSRRHPSPTLPGRPFQVLARLSLPALAARNSVTSGHSGTAAPASIALHRLAFALAGSTTGPQGEGRSDARFVSRSGRVVLETNAWKVAHASSLAGIKPVLQTGFLGEPVIVDSIELLRKGPVSLLRTRSKAGVDSARPEDCWATRAPAPRGHAGTVRTR